MANFPTSLDTLTNPTSGNTLDNPSHSLQHSDANDILEALERKVGIGSSVAGSATSGHALVASTGGTTSWTSIGTAGITSGSATNGQVLTANGSGAVSFNTLSTPGMVLLNTTSFSAVGSQSLPADSFTATYTNYRLVFNLTNTAAGYIRFKFRAAGVDTSSSLYGFTAQQVNFAAFSDLGNAATDPSAILAYNDSTRNGFSVELYSPQATTLSHFVTTGVYGRVAYYIAGQYNATTSFDSLTFTPPSGTFTGSVSVYGYNK